MLNVGKKRYFVIFCAFLAFASDRITKVYFVKQPDLSFIVWPKILVLEVHKNSGMVFGFVFNDLLFYVSFSLLSLILFYLIINYYQRKNFFLFSCLIFIIIGAFSNLLDRLQYGGVVDFINVPFWSIFNLADVYIIGAVILWFIYLIKYGEFSKKS